MRSNLATLSRESRRNPHVFHSYTNGSGLFPGLSLPSNFNNVPTAARLHRKVSAGRRGMASCCRCSPGAASSPASAAQGPPLLPGHLLPLRGPTQVRLVRPLLFLPVLLSQFLPQAQCSSSSPTRTRGCVYLKMPSKAVLPMGALPGCSH